MGKIRVRMWAVVLVLVLLSTFGLSCGGGGSKELVTITICDVTDLTGAASATMIAVNQSLRDLATYYNEEGMIPGVKLEVLSYDTQINPGKYILGVDYAAANGADVIYSSLIGSIAGAAAASSKIPIIGANWWKTMEDPPGWVFGIAPIPQQVVDTMLDWASRNDWDYEADGIPTIGQVDCQMATTVEIRDELEAYCQRHPDKFKWGGSILAPISTQDWGPDLEKKKDCDYLFLGFPSTVGPLLRDAKARGVRVKWLGNSGSISSLGFAAKLAGSDAVQGVVGPNAFYGWYDDNELVDLAKDLIVKYRGASALEASKASSQFDYVGSLPLAKMVLDIIKLGVKAVGAENFDGQAFYDAALKYNDRVAEGYPIFRFSETSRACIHDMMIFGWSSETQRLEMISDYVPLITD